MRKSTLLHVGIAPLALSVAMISAPVMAQDSDNAEAVDAADAAAVAAVQQDDNVSSDDFVVVTGSRIVRRDLESAAPVSVVDSEEFQLSGAVNVESVINRLPQVVPGTTAFSNNPGNGTSTLDLRGLGSTRTMVLVNGRRWMFYDTSQVVDLNTIPTFLLKNVDVVTGGASAVYGSDAISGVVNFNLRDDLNGALVGGQYSITEEGDGRRYNAYAALGTELSDGRGHATVYAEYYNRGDVFQGQRKFSEFVKQENADATGFTNGGSSTLPSGGLGYGLSKKDEALLGNNLYYGDFAANGAVVFDSPGNFRSRVGSDLYNYGPVNYLMIPQERYLMGGYADYEIFEGHNAYMEVSFVNNRVATELAATPVTGTFTVDLASVQGFLNADDYAQLVRLDQQETELNNLKGTPDADNPGQLNLAIQRRVIESGSRNSLDERNAFRTLVGMNGEITDNFNYDVYYSYSRTRNSNVQAGNISRSAFAAGLDGSASAINIFGPGTLTKDMVNQISILAQNGEVSVQQVFNGSVSGVLGNFGMGADDVGIAVGVEHRRLNSEFIPDTALASGDVIGFNAGEPTSGRYDVNEVFGEIRLPIAANQPGIHKLEVNGAVRYSDYSLQQVGSTWTWAAGAEYAPIPDFKIRGQYQRAVRAPNVGELFGGNSVGFPQAKDPCAQSNAATDATIRALCEATGVPSGSVGNANLQTNTQIKGQFGGNPNLSEEKSDSYTIGAVFRPTFLPGFSATLDYFNIKVKDTISVLGGGLANTLDLCYNKVQDINSAYCQAINRNPINGSFDDANTVNILNANIAKLATEGFDLDVQYTTPLGFSLMTDTGESRLNFNFLGTYLKKYEITPVADLPNEINECEGRFGNLACGEPRPKWKWTSRLSLIDGPLTTSFSWDHINSVKDDDDLTTFTVEKIGSYDLFDLTLSAAVSDNLTLTMGVRNLFNNLPDILGDNQEQANTWPGTYDVLGRDYFVSASMKF